MAFGVSNSFKRGTIKTYSRRRAFTLYEEDAEKPTKRIRMDATGDVMKNSSHSDVLSSTAPVRLETMRPLLQASSSQPTSPTLPTIFSDPINAGSSPLSSPPSSPPPQLPSLCKAPRGQTSTAPETRIIRSSHPMPLGPIAPNVRTSRPSKKPLVQMRIDLGGDIQKTCKKCGMEYVPSVEEDASLHTAFCSMNVDGIPLGHSFAQESNLRRVGLETNHVSLRDSIVLIDRASSQASRKKVSSILAVVNKELSATAIPEVVLWDTAPIIIPASHGSKRRRDAEECPSRAPRFKGFVFMSGERCIGFCLAEKITNAFQITDCHSSTSGSKETGQSCKSSSRSVSSQAQVALIGISRIWTSKAFRSIGIASELLECARKNFFYGITVPKELVAFSQPTESGGCLAERWYGANQGWLIYKDDL